MGGGFPDVNEVYRERKTTDQIEKRRSGNHRLNPLVSGCATSRTIDNNFYMNDKIILDACCGGRQMWFDKTNPFTVFMDVRNENETLCNGRVVKIKPTHIGDFRDMPFESCTFKLVVMDPPHLSKLGSNSYTAQKYGKLLPTWETDLKSGFDEAMRVLQPYGFLIFKWNEYEIPVSKIIDLFGARPLFGHRSGKHSKTHWLCFMKPNIAQQ